MEADEPNNNPRLSPSSCLSFIKPDCVLLNVALRSFGSQILCYWPFLVSAKLETIKQTVQQCCCLFCAVVLRNGCWGGVSKWCQWRQLDRLSGLISRIIPAYTCDFFCSSVGSTTLVLIIPVVEDLAASQANKFPNKHDFTMNHFKVSSLGFTGNKQRKEARET